MACFAFRFLLFSSCPLFFFFRPALGLVLPSWLCGLAFGVGWVVVSFSLTDDHTKRKGAPCWCVLACPVVGLLWVYYMLSAFLSADSFAFENIHPAPQVR